MEFDENIDPMIGRTLFIMRNERWRQMRKTMTPAFTGNKMRLMHKLMIETTKDFIACLRHDVDETGKVVETKELYQRYTTDVIASCAFGIKVNAYREPESEFYRTALAITTVTGLQGLKLFASIVMSAKMRRFFQLKLISNKYAEFFRRIILENITQREQNSIVRNDMIDLLIKAKGGVQNEMDEDRNGLTTDSQAINNKTTDKVTGECM